MGFTTQPAPAGEQEIIIHLHISAEEYLGHYRGMPKVRATATDGRVVLLPAASLRPYVTREGIHGIFRFHLSSAGKLQNIERLR